jgi:glutamate mutase epsilon subunit
MKCYNSIRNAETQLFNAQGSRVIIVVGQVGAVTIYVAAVEALSKEERQDETQFTTDIDVFRV